jgi:hypothetical protein
MQIKKASFYKLFSILTGFFLGLPHLFGQYHHEVNASWDRESATISGWVVISGPFQGMAPTTVLPIQYWPGDYHRDSPLNQEFLENQYTGLHFGAKTPRAEISAYSEKGLLILRQGPNGLEVVLPDTVQPGQSILIRLDFQYALPSAAHHGFGKGASEIRLANWFPRIPPYTEQGVPIEVPNNYQRFQAYGPGTFHLTFYHPMRTNCLCADAGAKSFADETAMVLVGRLQGSGDFPLVCGPFAYQLTNDNQLLLLTDQLPPVFDWAGAITLAAQAVERFLGTGASMPLQVVMLSDIGKLEPHPGLLWMPYEKDSVSFVIKLVGKLLRARLLHEKYVNEWHFPMLTTGLSQYFEHRFAARYFPEHRFLGPHAGRWYARFLNLDALPPDTETRLYYWYMARLGVDQPLNDPASVLSKGNYLAIARGKAALSFSYLESFAGQRQFDRGVHRWMVEPNDATPQSLERAVRYFHNRETNWWSDSLLPGTGKLDYKITKVDKCPTTLGFKVRNAGAVATPFSVTGIKDGAPLITLWYEGFTGSKLLQFHQEDYEALVIDYEKKTPEISYSGNYRRTHGLFRGMRNPRLQLFGGIEHPDRAQIFWMPHLDFNAYDKVLLGISFFNTTPIPRKFEYTLIPEFSTGTGKVMGTGGLLYRMTPEKGPFHMVTFSLYGRYNHYAPDLAFSRISPTVTAWVRKPQPRDENIHKLKLRLVSMMRESPEGDVEVPVDEAFDLSRASYQVYNFQYHWEYVNILRPHTFDFDLQHAGLFSRVTASWDKRWMLPNRKWAILRLFSGAFLRNEVPQTTFYSMGLSGTRDYLFDYSLIGRTDLTGIWSRQFFVTDGGFRSETGVFSNQWMTTAGVALPIYKVLGLYGDVGLVDNLKTVWWGYGIRVALLSDFLEFYLPIQSNQRDFITERGYFNNVRFVLNIRYDQIVQRLRRGYY